jgi:hypothetical protein
VESGGKWWKRVDRRFEPELWPSEVHERLGQPSVFRRITTAQQCKIEDRASEKCKLSETFPLELRLRITGKRKSDFAIAVDLDPGFAKYFPRSHYCARLLFGNCLFIRIQSSSSVIPDLCFGSVN